MLNITPGLKTWLVDHSGCTATGSDDYYNWNAAEALASGKLQPEKLIEFAESDLANLEKKEMSKTSPDPEKVFSNGNGNGEGTGPDVHLKKPSEQYCEKRFSAVHVKTGRPVIDPISRRECVSMSQASSARAGVFLKHLANRSGVVSCPLSEHEKNLLDEMTTRQAWCGKIGNEFYDYIQGPQTKALIDDATSGGIEIAPIEFDSDIVTFPLLHREKNLIAHSHSGPHSACYARR